MVHNRYDYLIIGGGLAAATAVKELVQLDPEASKGILAAEPEPPYDRPPLSKDYLLGRDARASLFLLKESTYRRYGIGLHLETPALSVDPKAHIVAIPAGEIEYGRLLIASGCSLKNLEIPGAGLAGFFYLRVLSDSEAIRSAAGQGRTAVMIGGGFIGLEVASALASYNINPTIVQPESRLLARYASEELSACFEELFADQGVHVIYGDVAAEIAGEGAVTAVVTKSGRTLPCDMACAGIGVYPNTAYLEGSGLTLNDGIAVNEYLEAAPGVYAAGDVANFPDLIAGRRRRIEHWDNAIAQGRTAARNMAGHREAFNHVSYFYSTMFDLTYEFFGDMTSYDEAVVRGSFERRSAAVLYLGEGSLKAALLYNRPPWERSAVQRLIAGGATLDAVRDRLAEGSFRFDSILKADTGS